MGRPRKPLEMQKGNLTIISMEQRRNEEKKTKTGSNQLSRPPDWLIDEVAVKEWKRIVKELKKINLIGNLDRNNLGGYCNAFANYIKATEILKNQTFMSKELKRSITYTIAGFCVFAGISRSVFYDTYMNKKRYSDIVTRMKEECEVDAREKF